VTTPGFVVELRITVPGRQPGVLARVEAGTPERAARVVRLQARAFAAVLPDDAPILLWIEGGYREAVADLSDGRAVSVGFDSEEDKHLEWQMTPAAQAEPGGSDAAASHRR